VLLSAGCLTAMFAFFYIGTAYLTSYGTSAQGAGLARPVVLGIGIAAALPFGLAIALAGVLSDRFGRRKVIMVACVVSVVWGLALFPLLDTGTPVAFAIGLTITLIMVGISYGPIGSFVPELFAPRHRYTGAGLSYNIAGVFGGAVPPLLAPGLTASFGGIGIGVMLSALGALSLVCTYALAETRGVPMAHEQIDQPPPATTLD
jgi:MFS family permease